MIKVYTAKCSHRVFIFHETFVPGNGKTTPGFNNSLWFDMVWKSYCKQLEVTSNFYMLEVTFAVWLRPQLSWCGMYMWRHSFVNKIYKKYQPSLF